MLKVDKKRHRHQYDSNYHQPQHIVGEVRIDAQHYTGNHRREFRLAFTINEVTHSNCAREDADDETIHGEAPSCWVRRIEGLGGKSLGATNR